MSEARTRQVTHFPRPNTNTNDTEQVTRKLHATLLGRTATNKPAVLMTAVMIYCLPVTADYMRDKLADVNYVNLNLFWKIHLFAPPFRLRSGWLALQSGSSEVKSSDIAADWAAQCEWVLQLVQYVILYSLYAAARARAQSPTWHSNKHKLRELLRENKSEQLLRIKLKADFNHFYTT